MEGGSVVNTGKRGDEPSPGKMNDLTHAVVQEGQATIVTLLSSGSGHKHLDRIYNLEIIVRFNHTVKMARSLYGAN